MRHIVRPVGMPPAKSCSHAVVVSGPLIGPPTLSLSMRRSRQAGARSAQGHRWPCGDGDLCGPVRWQTEPLSAARPPAGLGPALSDRSR